MCQPKLVWYPPMPFGIMVSTIITAMSRTRTLENRLCLIFSILLPFLKKCVITKKAHKKTTVMPGKSPADSSPFSLFIFTIFTHQVAMQSKRQASYCTDTNRLFPLYSHDTGNRRPDLCMSPDSALSTFSCLPKGYDLLRLVCRVLSGFMKMPCTLQDIPT